jgi:serine/threonine protein kinase
MLVRLSLAELRWTPTLRPLRADWMRISAGMSNLSCKLRIMFSDKSLLPLQDLIYTRSLADARDQCARALAFLFQSELDRRGLIHKDIKPANVLVDAADNVCLTGFGMASQLPHERQTPTPPKPDPSILNHSAPTQSGIQTIPNPCTSARVVS